MNAIAVTVTGPGRPMPASYRTGPTPLHPGRASLYTIFPGGSFVNYTRTSSDIILFS